MAVYFFNILKNKINYKIVPFSFNGGFQITPMTCTHYKIVLRNRTWRLAPKISKKR